MVWNRVPRIDWISIGLLCELCGSVVNPVDDSHRPELNHRDTEHTEKASSMSSGNIRGTGECGVEQGSQDRLDFNWSSL